MARRKRRRGCTAEDRRLGMDRPITRRDFVQGALAGAAGTWLGGALSGCADEQAGIPRAAQDAVGYYPPRLTGLRGSQPGSFEAAHALRDGKAAPEARKLAETYDLVVVGAGISGLAAAHFYRAAQPAARILILDNHDDFGGHARRNEFVTRSGMLLSNGGTYAIESPRPYSAVAGGLLQAIGIGDVAALARASTVDVYGPLGLRSAVFFDRQTFGRDHLAVGYGELPWSAILRDAPLSAAARRDVERLESGVEDFLPGLSSDAKKARLLRISYRDYLVQIARVDPAVVALYEARTKGWWAVGGDAVAALDAWGLDLPGFKGLRLEPGAISGMGYTPQGYAATGGSEFLHFPDGNATIARGLVRTLIPAAVPSGNIADLVTAPVDYNRLDDPRAEVRLRLNATVMSVRHEGVVQSSQWVRVTYIRQGQALAIRARHCILACNNAMIPYLARELPAAQQAALHEAVRSPLVYTSVAVRNWRPFVELGVNEVYAPGGYHTTLRLNQTIDIGSYRSPRSPDEPNLITMARTPCRPGLTEKEQNRAGRAELLATSFAVFEREIRDQLQRTLAGSSFDPARDIEAITVNRWPHGYAAEHNPLFDPDLPEAEQSYVRARARHGRLAIANSDAGPGAYTDLAIDQGHRAVMDLLGA